MRKFVLLAGLLIVSFACTAVADEISFSVIAGAPGSLTASAAGLFAGPGPNKLVSDSTNEFTQDGTFTLNTGPASTPFTVVGNILLVGFKTAGPASVLILSPTHTVLVSGSLEPNASFLTTFPDGTGSFLGKFHVNTVDPAVLALFGLGPAFNPDGSVSATFSHVDYDTATMTVSGELATAGVTIQTPTVPEPVGLGLLGMGLLTAAEGLRRRRAARSSKS